MSLSLFQRRWARYGLALAAVGVSALLRWLMPDVLGRAPYLGFYPAVVVAAALGGVGPGLMATLGSLLCVNLVFVQFSLADHGLQMRNLIWIIASAGVSLLAGRVRNARQRAEDEAAAARAAETALRAQAQEASNARARAEKHAAALRESEERYRGFIETAQEGIATHEPDGTIGYVNQHMADMLGYSPEEVIGSSSLDFLDDEQRESVIQDRESARVKGNLSTERRLRRKDGSTLWTLVNVSPRYDGEGNFLGYLAMHTDITERKRSEEALRESESRYRRLLESLPVPLGVVDSNGSIVQFNDRFTQVFGYTKEDIPTLEVWWLRAYPDLESRRRVIENWNAKMRRPEGAQIETEPEELNVTCKDGSVRVVVITNIALADCILAVFIDITARKHAEEALNSFNAELERQVASRTRELLKSREELEAERQRFYDVLETLPPMICLLTADYHIAFANRSFRERFGESHGRRCYEQCFDREEPCEFCESYTVLRTGQPHQWEVNSPDGSVIAAYDFPFADADGSPMILEMDIDITEQRKAAAALKEINVTLELLVEERTAELRANNEKLARSNRDLEHFAYVASHDLQEPLRTVRAYAQLLHKRYKGRMDSDADQFIDFVVDGAGRMQSLILDLLAYSRVSSAPRDLAPTNSESSLTHALASLRETLKSAGATVTSDPLPTVVADEKQLAQLLQNLIGNGIKFSRNGTPPHIHVSAHEEEHEWVFSVKDNGIGIEPQYHEKVFNIFERLHGQGEYSGTGIGLAICKRIVERHRGRIWLESRPGDGSVFLFAIPKQGK